MLRKQAAEDVQLVRAGGGDNELCLCGACFLEHFIGSAVAANAHNVVGVHCRGDYAVVGVDHNDVMPFGRELLCQS